MDTRASEQVAIDWSAGRGPAKRRNHKAEAIDRVEGALRALGAGEVSTVVVDAPQTRIYVQFSRVDADIVGEAVGETNIRKLDVHHIGAHLRKVLPELGWLPPDPERPTGGNWFHAWPLEDWRPDAVARLTVKTFAEGYGLEPWALSVSTAK